MQWNKLETLNDLTGLIQDSQESPNKYFLIFKHSTRCPVSAMSLNRVEKDWNQISQQVSPYFLDLIAFRNISDKISIDFNVRHESPQVLLIKNGVCVYHESHHLITIASLANIINN
jgi:bacillithiol system protein YtxJ